MSLLRTISKPPSRLRTSIVRLRGTLSHTVAVSLSLVITGAAAGPTPQDEAAGWLQLESDQRRFRERVEPLAPRDEVYLDRLERRQERELRTLQSEQQRERRIGDRSERMRAPERRVRPRTQGPEQRRELERQRLNQRIQREAFGFGTR